MSSFSRIQLFVAVFVFASLTHVVAHTYLTKPPSRSNQAETQTGCRGPSCLGPCDIPLSRATRAPIRASRGDTIVVEWPRNNHAGGFIRFAWAPTALSDSHAAFDAHVQQINCHEVGNPTPGQCAPADPINDPNGGGSGPGDGSSGACATTITVPLDLADGKWTLQWSWFGGAFSLGDYYSCVDYTISGGQVGVLVPVFKGGDFSYPNQQKCKFFNTDKLHVCTNEPCQAPIYPASQARSGPPAAGQLGLSVSVTVPTAPVQPPVVQPPVVQPPVAVVPATTAAKPVVPQVPSTTGRVVVQPPVVQPPVVQPPVVQPPVVQPPVVKPTTVTVPSTNCAGVSTVSSSTATIVSVDSWGSQFHGVINIQVNEAVLSNWVLEVTWPEGASAHVLRYFNAGSLQCEGSRTSYFMPSASWSNNLSRGSQVQVEFIASTGSNMDGNFILANSQVRLLKQ